MVQQTTVPSVSHQQLARQLSDWIFIGKVSATSGSQIKVIRPGQTAADPVYLAAAVGLAQAVRTNDLVVVVRTGSSWTVVCKISPAALAAPTAAAGANAGTGPPAPVVAAASSDARGSLTFGTGTAPAAGAQVVVTFHQAYAAAPFVVISPANDAAAALAPYVSSISTTGFTISTHTAPAASQANTTYAFQFQVLA